jgi:hypothetical protein
MLDRDEAASQLVSGTRPKAVHSSVPAVFPGTVPENGEKKAHRLKKTLDRMNPSILVATDRSDGVQKLADLWPVACGGDDGSLETYAEFVVVVCVLGGIFCSVGA